MSEGNIRPRTPSRPAGMPSLGALTVLLHEPDELVQLPSVWGLEEELCDLSVSFDDQKKTEAPLWVHRWMVEVRLPGLLEEQRLVARKRGGGGTYWSFRASSMSRGALETLLHWAYEDRFPGDVSFSLLAQTASAVDSVLPLMASAVQWEAERATRTALEHGSFVDALLAFGPVPQPGLRGRLASLVEATVFSRWDSFIVDKEAGRRLGIERMQSLAARRQAMTKEDAAGLAELLQPGPRPAGAATALKESRRAALAGLRYTDCQLLCQGGELVPCHQALLAAAGLVGFLRTPLPVKTSPRASSAAAVGSPRSSGAVSPRTSSPRGPSALLSSSASSVASLPGGSSAAAAGTVVSPPSLANVPARAVRSMLAFLYSGAIGFQASDALLLVAHVCVHMDCPPLMAACTRAMRAGLSMTSPSMAMDLLALSYRPEIAAHPIVFGLRKQAIQFVVEHFTQLDLAPLLSMDPKARSDVLFALQRHLIEGERLHSSPARPMTAPPDRTSK